MKIKIHKIFPEYELIDCGSYKKLERFGNKILIRPEQSAAGNTELSFDVWKKQAEAEFIETSQGKGAWKVYKKNSSAWKMNYKGKGKNIDINLQYTKFKHVGVFPEQSFNWDYLQNIFHKFNTDVQLLNLFAYTGVASLLASSSGYNVTHVDALKQIVQWGKTQAKQNGIENIRWIVDDANKFVQREIRRNKKYHVIIMDPPTTGMGPKGERWKFERDMDDFVQSVKKLLEPQCVLIMSLYANSMNEKYAHKLILEHFRDFSTDFCNEIKGVSNTGNSMTHGYLVRLTRGF